MLSLHGYPGCRLTQRTPLPEELDATFAIGPLSNESTMVEARVSLRWQPGAVFRLCRDGAEVATLLADATLPGLEEEVAPMVELTATVLGTLIHQVPEDDRPQARTYVRAARAGELKHVTRRLWPPRQ